VLSCPGVTATSSETTRTKVEMSDPPVRHPIVLVVDGAGCARYVDGPSGVVFPPDAYDTHVVSFGSRPPKEVLEHVASNIEVRDRDDVPAAARTLVERIGVPDAVVTVREQDLLLAAGLRDELGVPGLTVQQTTRFRDKIVMKRHLDKTGVRTPRSAPYTPEAAHTLLDEVGRVVIKPRDGAGSAGVHIVGSHAEVRALAATVGRSGRFEVEEFVRGTLHHVDSIVREGRVVVATVSQYLDPTTAFAGQARMLRSVNLPEGPETRALRATNAAVLASHPYLSGVTHLEAFLVQDGEVVFCEVAARVGGGAVAPAFHARTGVDLYATHLYAQAGVLPPESVPISDLLAGWLLLYAGPGIMTRPPGLPQEEWVLGPDVYIPDDGLLGAPSDVSQAVVSVAVTGPDLHALEQRQMQVADEVRRTMVVKPAER
jgi:ATP-grasp domain